MRYLIIGLGIYGTNLARDLTDLGNEVIGADVRSTNVEAIKDYISTAYTIDSTDPAALAVLPLKKRRPCDSCNRREFRCEREDSGPAPAHGCATNIRTRH